MTKNKTGTGKSLSKWLLITLCAIFAFSSAHAARSAEIDVMKNKPLTMAHRGGDIETDENTISSYSNAIKYGMDVIECDPRLTKDDLFVIMHDPTVDRTTDGTGKVADLTLAEIKQLKTKSGQQVPTFDEVLTLAREKGVDVFLDTKIYTDEYMTKLMDAVIRNNMRDRVIAGLWTSGQVSWMKKNYPDVTMSAVTPSAVTSIPAAKKSGVDWIGIDMSKVNPEQIRKAGENGIKLVTLQINDPAVIRQMIDDGLQVIQTDDPKLLRSIMDELFPQK